MSLPSGSSLLIIEDAGQKLKRRREELNLRYRDVEEASQRIAERRKNDEYAIALSRLADIENKGTVPSIFRMYSLAAIYRLDYFDVLEWYGVDLSSLPADSGVIEPSRTHMIGFSAERGGSVTLPLALDPGIDLRRTTYLSRMVQKWGRLPLVLLSGADPRTYRFAYIGTDDWTMAPIIPPGSLVLIDETRRKIQNGGWTGDYDRPIYFLEHRGGYAFGWCSIVDATLVVQPHPSSENPPQLFAWPSEVDVIGQLTGAAMKFDTRKKRQRP